MKIPEKYNRAYLGQYLATCKSQKHYKELRKFTLV